MTGENISKLAAAVAGMNTEDIWTSKTAWRDGVDSLNLVSQAIDAAIPNVRKGFSDEGAPSETSERAVEALRKIRDDVIGPRRNDMERAEDELVKIRTIMFKAAVTNSAMPDSAPGPAPKFQGGPGSEADQITDLKIHAARTRVHNQQVEAYGDADEKARQQLVDLNQTYDDASLVMAEIHGEPVPDPVVPGGGGAGGQDPGSVPGPRMPVPGPTTPTNPTNPVNPVNPIGPTNPTNPTIPTNPTFPTDPTDPTFPLDPIDPTPTPTPITGPDPMLPPSLDPPPGSPVGPPSGSISGPGSVGGEGGGLSPIAGGAAAGAGALGGLGAKGLLGRLSTGAVGVGGTPTRPLGASGRSASSGVLGKGGLTSGKSTTGGAVGAKGAMTPGSGGGRGTGGRGTGTGRGAGRSGGTGRGGAGGRGAGGRGAGAGGGRGGRTKDDPSAKREREYDVEEEWTDDEGSSGVLG